MDVNPQLPTRRDNREPGVDRDVPDPIRLCLFRAVSAEIVDCLAFGADPLTDFSVILSLPLEDVRLRTSVRVSGRTNMPCPGAHSKYLCPWTVPSFLPLSSSSSIPIHCPVEKCVGPINRTTPGVPFEYWTLVPGESSVMLMGQFYIGHLVGSRMHLGRGKKSGCYGRVLCFIASSMLMVNADTFCAGGSASSFGMASAPLYGAFSHVIFSATQVIST